MNAWILFEGSYYSDVNFIRGVYSTKKKLVDLCREDGFKWNSEQHLFLKDEVNTYRRFVGYKMDSEDFISDSV